MDDKQFLEALDKGFGTMGDKLSASVSTSVATLEEVIKKYIEVKPEDIQTASEVKKEEAEKSEMEQLAGITGFQVWDIPVGEALVGGFVAVFASELIDGFLLKQGDWMKGLIKLAGAGAAIKWGQRFLGSTGSKAVAILLAYDGVRSLIPIDSWARRGASAVTGMLPAGGLGGFTSNAGGRSASLQAGYYEALKGGVG